MSIYHSLVTILDRLEPKALVSLSDQGRKNRSQIFHDLLNPQKFLAVMDSLSDEERTSLRRFIMEERVGYLKMEQLPSGASLLSKLGNAYIAFSVRDQTFRQVIPLDFYPAMLGHLLEERPPALIGANRSARHDAGQNFQAILPLFHLLSQARMEPIARTTTGQIYRRIITKLKKSLPPSVTAEQLDTAAHSAYYYHLLKPTVRERALTTTAEADIFFTHTVDEIQSLLLQAALDNSPLFSLFVVALAGLLHPDEWLDIEVALKWAKAEKIPGAYDTYTLSYFLNGLIERGIWERAGKNLGRLTDAYYYGWVHGPEQAQAAPRVLIEPTGDVLIPPDALPSTRWELDSMATLIKYDQMTVYHIDRSAIAYAVLNHWTAPSYLSALTAMSRVETPDNLATNIEDWFRQLARHNMMHGTVLHSDDPQDSTSAERILREHVLRRLSPTDLIVSTDAVKQVQKLLEKSGMPINPHIEEYDRPTEEGFYEDYDPYLGPIPPDPVRTVQTVNLQRRLEHALIAGSEVSLEVLNSDSGELSRIRLRPLRLDQNFLVGISEQDNPAQVPVAAIQTCEVSGP